MIEKGLEDGVFEESDGAVVFRGEKYGLHTRVFKTQHGTTTYETRDLGLPILKQNKFPFNTNITITAVEQKTYFDVVFKAFSLLKPDFKGELIHVSHGMMQLNEGKMSSRYGNVITGESLIKDMKEGAEKKMKSCSHDVIPIISQVLPGRQSPDPMHAVLEDGELILSDIKTAMVKLSL